MYDTERAEKAVEAAANQAETHGFASIAASFPECKHGDFPPDAALELHNALRTAFERALDVWLTFNHPTRNGDE